MEERHTTAHEKRAIKSTERSWLLTLPAITHTKCWHAGGDAKGGGYGAEGTGNKHS